ncbi:HAD-IIIA family hydrolase [Rubellimicrobium rubrum]|uniref:HAD-IIIA family hydrolase n=2 Tax=Rubellimicrobium rubrum TaxID=2585369 RepID=A0A5C4MXB6_9RHOB|nr:HAD-IIIA family hydrolase [Rubellimicrobium rubrum]
MMGSPFPDHVRLVIFDADNTLRRVTIPGKVCPHGPGEWEPMPGIREALASLRWGPDGLRLGMASNQDHVFYGHLTAAMARRLLQDAAEAATGHRPPDGAVRFCAHAMDAGCGCRKPAPGLLHEAMAFHEIGPEATLFVGDAEVDREAARRADIPFLHVADLLASRS